MLADLVANAIPTRSGRRRSTISLAAVDGRLALRVADSGPGIAAEDRERVFETVRPPDPARRGRGSGLGLAIGRWIAELHAATLQIE